MKRRDLLKLIGMGAAVPLTARYAGAAPVDPVLKPRITEIPRVSEKALSLFKNNLVWDDVLPWGEHNNASDTDELLPRFHRVGVDFCSLSVARTGIADTVRYLGTLRQRFRERAAWLVVAESLKEIQAARAAGKLAVNFHFQNTVPFEDSLEMIQVYYDLGVRQVGLAYNIRNRVGDGIAEPNDAGLSRFGVQVIKEMNRVGMIVDGSHTGYRTTMEAMKVCQGPFIFSHSNAHAVRPHYRSITDEQMKACAQTGGVVGINGVGFWVGDMDASTAAIFRCLDYAVQLLGAEHVGLGFDYIHDLERLIQAVRAAPLAWPPYQGEEMVKHNYAGPEQMVELVQMMLDRGYPEAAIVNILGGNWARIANQVWK